MSPVPPVLSVIIPVRNGGPFFRDVLDRLLEQEAVPAFEVVVIDSGSSDGTWELLDSLPVVRLRVPPESFNHGSTRNTGIERAQGSIIVCTVADALPTDRRWLQRLVVPLDDPTVAAVCGKQIIPHEPSMDPLRWFRPDRPLQPHREQFTAEAWADASPARRRAAAGLDNVTAAYRGSLLRRRPFAYTDFGEDLEWGKWALESGHAIVFEPRAQVAHYHAYEPEFVFRRTFRELLGEWELFGLIPPAPSAWRLTIRPLLGFWLRRPEVPLAAKWKWSRLHVIHQRARIRALREFRLAAQRGPEAVWEANRRINPHAPQGKREAPSHR
jgi:rhamnosyltransferase